MAKYSDFEKLASTKPTDAPFPHLLCPAFIRQGVSSVIDGDFPDVPAAGSFPLASLRCGNAFNALIEEIRSTQMAKLLSEKLNVDIVGKPTMVTVRGFCRQTDGKIHLDSGGKLVTVLLYLNTEWDETTGGRLRLLYDGRNIENYFLEIPPGNGTLLAFRCDSNAWHGHLPYAGERRAIQLNWVASDTYRHREAARHFLSAALKRVQAALPRRRT